MNLSWKGLTTTSIRNVANQMRVLIIPPQGLPDIAIITIEQNSRLVPVDMVNQLLLNVRRKFTPDHPLLERDILSGDIARGDEGLIHLRLEPLGQSVAHVPPDPNKESVFSRSGRFA